MEQELLELDAEMDELELLRQAFDALIAARVEQDRIVRSQRAEIEWLNAMLEYLLAR